MSYPQAVPQYGYAPQPAIYATSQMPMMAPQPVMYGSQQPMPIPMQAPMQAPMMAPAVGAVDDAPPGYRLAGYAPEPDAGNVPEGWEFVNKKWIYVGKPEPIPQVQQMYTQPAPITQTVPFNNYVSQAMPMQQMTYTQPTYSQAAPAVYGTSQMPMMAPQQPQYYY